MLIKIDPTATLKTSGRSGLRGTLWEKARSSSSPVAHATRMVARSGTERSGLLEFVDRLEVNISAHDE